MKKSDRTKDADVDRFLGTAKNPMPDTVRQQRLKRSDQCTLTRFLGGRKYADRKRS